MRLCLLGNKPSTVPFKDLINDYYFIFLLGSFSTQILSHYPLSNNYDVSALEGILEVVHFSPTCHTLNLHILLGLLTHIITMK